MFLFDYRVLAERYLCDVSKYGELCNNQGMNMSDKEKN